MARSFTTSDARQLIQQYQSVEQSLIAMEALEKENARKGALFLKRILESNSLRSMSMSAGQSMPWHVANGMMEMANGHLIKGIKCFLSPVKVPKLPKEENAQ